MSSTQRTPTAFTHAIFINKNQTHHEALARRIDALYARREATIPRENISNLCGDANCALPELLKEIRRRDYLFVFADIQNPSHWPWNSVRRLRELHQSVDLYVLFPIDMGLVRLAGYNLEARKRWAPIPDPFFGSAEWAAIADRFRQTDAQAPSLRRALVDLYLQGLKELWAKAESVGGLRRRGNHVLYEMLFASNAEQAHRIARGAARRMREFHSEGQGEFNLL